MQACAASRTTLAMLLVMNYSDLANKITGEIAEDEEHEDEESEQPSAPLVNPLAVKSIKYDYKPPIAPVLEDQHEEDDEDEDENENGSGSESEHDIWQAPEESPTKGVHFKINSEDSGNDDDPEEEVLTKADKQDVGEEETSDHNEDEEVDNDEDEEEDDRGEDEDFAFALEASQGAGAIGRQSGHDSSSLSATLPGYRVSFERGDAGEAVKGRRPHAGEGSGKSGKGSHKAFLGMIWRLSGVYRDAGVMEGNGDEEDNCGARVWRGHKYENGRGATLWMDRYNSF